MRLSWFRRLKTAFAPRPRKQRYFRPRLRTFEDRVVPSTFSGTVFNDAASSGVYSGQPGLAGWTVWLDDDRDGVLNNNEPSAVTDANGHYLLDTTGQPLGTGPASVYYLGFGLQNGDGGRWVPTTSIFAIDNPNTEADAIRNFGVKFQPYGNSGPAGSETAVNVNTAESASTYNGSPGGVANAMSADANGDYVVAWQFPQGTGTGVSARVFNADGSPRTGELAVGTGVTGTGVPSVAMAGNGQFVVAWRSSSSTIAMAIYHLDGTLMSNSSTIKSGWLQGIAADSVGDFAVLYGGKTNSVGVVQPTVQRYTATGAANGSPIIVASPHLVNYDSTIAMAGNGNFTVGWDDVVYNRQTGIDTSDVYAQRYTSAGRTNGSTIVVGQLVSDQPLVLRPLAMNSSGQFVVTWSNYYAGPTAYAQVYTAAGSPTGSVVSVAPNTAVATAMDAAGNVTFVWTSDGSGGYAYAAGNVHYRQLLASGQLTPELIANSTTVGYHAAAGVAAGNGTFVIAWVGNGAGDSNGIYLQRFANGPQVGAFSASASTISGGSAMTLTASNLSDPNAGATITRVAFYATDGSGNQYLLGYGTNNNGVWSFTFTVNLAAGNYTLFAEAVDSNGILGGDSAPWSLTVT